MDWEGPDSFGWLQTWRSPHTSTEPEGMVHARALYAFALLACCVLRSGRSIFPEDCACGAHVSYSSIHETGHARAALWHGLVFLVLCPGSIVSWSGQWVGEQTNVRPAQHILEITIIWFAHALCIGPLRQLQHNTNYTREQKTRKHVIHSCWRTWTNCQRVSANSQRTLFRPTCTYSSGKGGDSP